MVDHGKQNWGKMTFFDKNRPVWLCYYCHDLWIKKGTFFSLENCGGSVIVLAAWGSIVP
jgi:hypothetical protein